MKITSIRKFILPPGPILSLTLIGLLLLSALLYYRAIKIQRFLEPALALSQPRNEFNQGIENLLMKEFGAGAVEGIKFTPGAILVDESMLFSGNSMKDSSADILKKLSNVFLAALKDEHIRSHVDLVLVSERFPVSPDPELNERMRLVQFRSELILDALFRAEPELEREYGTYFAATYIPINPSEKRTKTIEFIIIPSEQLHIDVLQRLRKYVH